MLSLSIGLLALSCFTFVCQLQILKVLLKWNFGGKKAFEKLLPQIGNLSLNDVIQLKLNNKDGKFG